MNNRFAALLMAALWIPESAHAELLWQSDFEENNLSEWSGKLNPDKNGSRQNIVVVDTPVHSGARAAELTIHPDDLWPGNNHNRVELHQDGQRTKEGETTFFSFYFMLHDDAQVHDDIGYWESDNSYQQSMALYVDPSPEGTTLGFRTNRPSGKEHFKVPLTAQAWHQVTMQILWSTDASKGRVSIWLDGKQVADEVPAQTKPDGNDLFIQVGFHRNASEAAVETISIDDAVEGTTLSDVLMEPAPDAPDAGASGPGGETGGDASTSGDPSSADAGANGPAMPEPTDEGGKDPAGPGSDQGDSPATTPGDDSTSDGAGADSPEPGGQISGSCQVTQGRGTNLTLAAALILGWIAGRRRKVRTGTRPST